MGESMIDQYVLPYWSWLASVAIFALVGQVLKRKILVPQLARRSRLGLWAQRTLPLHPVLAGVVLGLVPEVPVADFVHGRFGASLYFGSAGVASTFVYDVVRTWAKARGHRVRV